MGTEIHVLNSIIIVHFLVGYRFGLRQFTHTHTPPPSHTHTHMNESVGHGLASKASLTEGTKKVRLIMVV